MVFFTHDQLLSVPLVACGLTLGCSNSELLHLTVHESPDILPLHHILYLFVHLCFYQVVTLHAVRLGSGVNYILVNPCKCWLQNHVLFL